MNYSNIVIDTSLVVHSLTDLDRQGAVAAQFFHNLGQTVSLTAPPLFLSETESSLNLWRIRKGRTKTKLNAKREILDAMSIQIIYLPEAHTVAREIADNLRLPRVYDATFAALAKIKNVDYYTADKTFYNAAHRMYPFVKLVA